jgi:hypothetical protein
VFHRVSVSLRTCVVGFAQDLKPHLVYIIGGQSQATGKGMTCELLTRPDLQQEVERAVELGDVVRVHYPHVSPSQEDLQVLRHALYDDDMGRTDSVSGWVQPNASRVKREGYADTRLDDISLTDGRIAPGWSTLGEVAQGSKACTFGPEVSFGTHMAAAKPGHKITILKVTWPGCDIVTYRKSLYPTIISTLREYDADVEMGAYELGGMLWLQGESDAGVREKDIWSATQTVSR